MRVAILIGVNMTKAQRLLSFLSAGSTATPSQIKGMFGIANPSATVTQLRKEGHCIYANSAKLKNGTAVTKYRLGTPSKAMVAHAVATGFFSA
jgi:hypothetical protein